MLVMPKIRDFICTTAHPKGAFLNVKKKIDYINSKNKNLKEENILIIGCSTGYGLSCRIAAAFLKNSPTIGVMLERPPKKNKTASPGWYNTAFFEEFAKEKKIYKKTINMDAFSDETIEKTIQTIKKDLKKIDLVIYSLAAPRRKMPDGTIYSSVLKPIGKSYQNKTIDLNTKTIFNVTIPPATEEEIKSTIKVMGGENLFNWVEQLKKADVLEKDAKIISFSYEGPKITHQIYKNGTIGMAKKNLLETTYKINKEFKDLKAYVSLNKALITQASAAIPVVPLYISILYKIMKEENLHEGCIEQAYRLFSEKLIEPIKLDEKKRIRLDDFEMLPKIQKKVELIWQKVNTKNAEKFLDLKGWETEFLNMFGFGFDEIDYEKEVNHLIEIDSLKN